ncbi:MAG TPA: hypothetical protein G4O10_02135 [Dehalococcoidia bacterium]|nr:hypothetical protein [Dehalococcoidia bacterium]
MRTRLWALPGALKHAAPLLNDTFCCVYGDSYPLADLSTVMRYFEAQKKLALMTVFKNNDHFDKSNTVAALTPSQWHTITQAETEQQHY